MVRCRRMWRSIIATELACALMVGSAHAQQAAQDVKVFGANVPARGGAFTPAGRTDLACTAIDAGRCYDGKTWRALYPAVPREYAVPTTDKVACVVIAQADCWT